MLAEDLFLPCELLCCLSAFEVLQLVEALHAVDLVFDPARLGRLAPTVLLRDQCWLEVTLFHLVFYFLTLVL